MLTHFDLFYFMALTNQIIKKDVLLILCMET